MESKNDLELINQNESLNGALKTIADSFKNIMESNHENDDNNSNQASEQSIASKPINEMIHLNVRGIVFKICIKRLANLPRSRLARLASLIRSEGNSKELTKLCDDFDLDQMEFYFDRDPFILNNILNLYYTGKLHVNHSECVYFIRDELEYWQIDEYSLDVFFIILISIFILSRNF